MPPRCRWIVIVMLFVSLVLSILTLFSFELKHNVNQSKVISRMTKGRDYSIKRKCPDYASIPGKDRNKPGHSVDGIYICGSLLPYQMHKVTDIPTFQPVWLGELYITSAFFDERGVPGRVKIIGLTSYALDKTDIHCTLWYHGCQKVISVKAKAQSISHHAPFQKSFKHLGYFFFCDTNQREVPDYVSLAMRPCDNPQNLLEVNKLTPYNGPVSIAHCLSPLHGLYDPYRALEWISFIRVLGVDHIYIYDTHSISEDVHRVLNYFVQDGFVTIVRWHIDDRMSVRGFAQRTMLNDCTYRAYGKYMYVSNHDLDEFIIPVKTLNLKTFLQQKSKGTANIFRFRSAHFCTTREDLFATSSQLRTMTYMQRKVPEMEVMKVITKPEASLEMGVHMVIRPAKGGVVHIPTADEAFVHHYRFWDEHSTTCNIEDRSAKKYEQILIKEVDRVATILNFPH